MVRLKYFLIYIIAFLFVFSSCEDDDLTGAGGDGKIILGIDRGIMGEKNGGGANTSRGGAIYNETEFELNGENVYLTFTAQNNKDLVLEKTHASRGAAYDNENNLIPKIYATAILNDDGVVYFDNECVDISDKKGVTNYYWPLSNVSFYAYAVSKDFAETEVDGSSVAVVSRPNFVIDGGNYNGTFDYILPLAADADAEQKQDATNQPDIVFSIKPNCAKSEVVDMVFHHALSAIVFKVGQMPKGAVLKSIVIEGVNTSGSCSMAYDEENGVLFDWNCDDSEKGTYTETLNQRANAGDMIGGNEAVFMMIPQSLVGDEDSSPKFILTFALSDEDGAREYTIEKDFKSFISSWEADKKYIFTLGTPEEVKVEVTDVVEGRVKKDVKIKNTGVSTAYIRAKIMGYWVIPDDVDDPTDYYIVKKWDAIADGEFVWGYEVSATESTHWRMGADGYYYYMSPVERDTFVPVDLFQSYTLTALAPAVNAELEMIIAVQAVSPLQVSSIWPQEITNDLIMP